MATPERHWDYDDYGHDEWAPGVMGVEADHAGHYEVDEDPWAELGIAAVICFLLLAIFLPGLT
jgi:hypothetical protein